MQRLANRARKKRVRTVVALFAIDGVLLLLPYVFVFFLLSDTPAWPQNDDPFYVKPVFHFVEQGEWQWFRQRGELSATTLTHLFTGILACQLLGTTVKALFVSCIVQQWLGAIAIYAFARLLLIERGLPLLIASTFSLTPVYFGHAFTFMTDGPATAWGALALFCFFAGFKFDDRRWLFVGSCCVAWGFWIRQTNLLLVIAPLITLLSIARRGGKSPGSLWRDLFATVLLPACALILLESGILVHSSAERLPTVAPIHPWSLQRVKTIVISIYGLGLLLGMFALPLLPLMFQNSLQPLQRSRPKQRVICVTVASLTTIAWFAPFVATSGRACITNSTGCFLQNGHWGPIFLSDMDEPGRWGELNGVQWPLLVWQLLTIASILSWGLVMAWGAWTLSESWRRSRLHEPLLKRLTTGTGCVVCAGIAIIALLLFINPLLDRYWLFLFPLCALWIVTLAADQGWHLNWVQRSWGIGILTLFFGVSTIFTHDSLAWNNARWQYVQERIANGIKPEEIDAGRDVNAWFRMAEDPDTFSRDGDHSAWWSGRAHLSIATGPRLGWYEVDRIPWFAWATMQQHDLIVLKKQRLSPTMPALLADQETP